MNHRLLAVLLALLLASHGCLSEEDRVGSNAEAVRAQRLVKERRNGIEAPASNQEDIPVKRYLRENNIYGGQQATPGEYEFMVHGRGCGASLVAKDVVLTAAHCRSEFTGSVYVGAYRDKSPAEGAEQRAIVGTLRRHPKYNGRSMVNDFLVFKIKPSSKTPIKLNFDNSIPTNNEVLTTIGFGKMSASEGGGYAKILREVDVNYVPQSQCNGRQMYNGDIVEGVMLCAAKPGKDSCYGDSGGPIFTQSGYQVGVTSWGQGCAKAQYPGVYSRIAGDQAQWIKNNICDLTDFESELDFCSGGGGGTGGGGTGGGGTGGGGTTTDANFFVEVQYDKFPQEIIASITDTQTGNRVWNHPKGTGRPGEFNQAFYWNLPKLVPGRKYKIIMKDSFGDGFCCNKGARGYIYVYAETTSGQEVSIKKQFGKFARSKTVYFVVPNI